MDYKAFNREVLRTMHRFKRYNKTALFGALTRNEFFALEIMQGHGPLCHHSASDGVYVSELAEKLEVSPPAVSRMLKSMEQNGLIARVVDQYDRRNTCVTATDAGRQACDDTRLRFDAFTCKVVEQMGAQDTEMLLTLLNRLVTIMEATPCSLKEEIVDA